MCKAKANGNLFEYIFWKKVELQRDPISNFSKLRHKNRHLYQIISCTLKLMGDF